MIEIKEFIKENVKQNEHVFGWKELFIAALNDSNPEYFVKGSSLFVYNEYEDNVKKTTVNELLAFLISIEEGYISDGYPSDILKLTVVQKIKERLVEDSIEGLVKAIEYFTLNSIG
ncbi:hypothetical protein ACV3V0_15555 [Clostridium perfringens]